MDTDAFVVVLDTRHVTVRARLAVIEIRQRAGSDDDWVIASVLVLAVGGAVGLLTAPLSAATAVLAPFVLRVAWTAEGAGTRRAGRAGPRRRGRGGRADPATAGARADPARLTAASGTFRMIDRRRGLRNVPVAARRSAPGRQASPSVIVGDFLTLNASVAPTLTHPVRRPG